VNALNRVYEWLFGNLNNLWTMPLVRSSRKHKGGRAAPKEMMLPLVFIVAQTHAPNN
jgi:hypothetical protein